jgi:starvation-inducible DNA-binding protein
MNATKNDLPAPVRKRVAEILNARLADAIDLALQAKQAHWNVKGPQFIALHELFDQAASGVVVLIDRSPSGPCSWGRPPKERSRSWRSAAR